MWPSEAEKLEAANLTDEHLGECVRNLSQDTQDMCDYVNLSNTYSLFNSIPLSEETATQSEKFHQSGQLSNHQKIHPFLKGHE